MATIFQRYEHGNHFRKKNSNKGDNYKVKESLENDNIKCEPGGKVERYWLATVEWKHIMGKTEI